MKNERLILQLQVDATLLSQTHSSNNMVFSLHPVLFFLCFLSCSATKTNFAVCHKVTGSLKGGCPFHPNTMLSPSQQNVLLNSNCSPHSQILVCSTFALFCFLDFSVQPCHQLCLVVKSSTSIITSASALPSLHKILVDLSVAFGSLVLVLFCILVCYLCSSYFRRKTPPQRTAASVVFTTTEQPAHLPPPSSPPSHEAPSTTESSPSSPPPPLPPKQRDIHVYETSSTDGTMIWHYYFPFLVSVLLFIFSVEFFMNKCLCDNHVYFLFSLVLRCT